MPSSPLSFIFTIVPRAAGDGKPAASAVRAKKNPGQKAGVLMEAEEPQGLVSCPC
jgi:hypothetical protein